MIKTRVFVPYPPRFSRGVLGWACILAGSLACASNPVTSRPLTVDTSDPKPPKDENTKADAGRSLRLDRLPADLSEQVKAIAQAEGGVERRHTNTSFHYTNYICRFDLDLPGSWQEFETQDFNGGGCTMNLTTPDVPDPAESKPIPNAVLVRATKFSTDSTREQMHRGMVSGLVAGGAHFDPVTPSLLEGALHDHYVDRRSGDSFEGDLVTFRRGAFLYQLLFTATSGSYQAGRANFLDLVRKARWNIPSARTSSRP